MVNGEDLPGVKKFKDVRNDLIAHFSPDSIIITEKVLVLAACLDPSYHWLSFLNPKQWSAVYDVIKKKCQELKVKKWGVEVSDAQSEPAPKNMNKKLYRNSHTFNIIRYGDSAGFFTLLLRGMDLSI